MRLWRERVNALDGYVYDRFHAPVKEGYREAPQAVREAVRGVQDALRALEDVLYKIDRKRPAVGGAVELEEKRRV